jgi:hypothetical protein
MRFLTLQTIVGPKAVPAPEKWKFDKTTTIVWAKLLELARDYIGPFQRQRDKYVAEGQIDVLANVLANSLGMADYYWRRQALDIAEGEKADV